MRRDWSSDGGQQKVEAGAFDDCYRVIEAIRRVLCGDPGGGPQSATEGVGRRHAWQNCSLRGRMGIHELFFSQATGLGKEKKEVFIEDLG